MDDLDIEVASLNGEDEFSDPEDFVDDIDQEDDFTCITDHNQFYDNLVSTEKNTAPIMTKYEKARILGERANQISNGAKPLVKVPNNIKSELDIAKLELIERKLPFIIRRWLPNGKYEDWRIEEMIIIDN